MTTSVEDSANDSVKDSVTPLSARQQALVVEASATIETVARAVARRSSVPFDELRAIGFEIAATRSKRYDAGLGVPFHLFILKALKGAMLDAAFPRHKARHLYASEVDVASLPGPQESSFEEAELAPLDEHTVGIVLSASFPSGGALERAGWQAHVVDTLRREIQALSPEERALAQAIYWDGLTMDQASKHLQVPLRTLQRDHAHLKAKLFRALRRHDVTELAAP
jgi:RNA polymerase sigma factor (sigma-70 family)